MSDSEFQRISSLFEAIIAGTLTLQQKEDLECALVESEPLRVAYLQAMSMHLDLDQLSRSDEDIPELVKSTEETLVPDKHNLWRSRIFQAGLAASILVLVSLLTVLLTTPQSNPVAVVPQGGDEDHSPKTVAVANAILLSQGGDPTTGGQKVTIGKNYVLTEWVLGIEFASGARAVIQAPSGFTAEGRQSLRVRSGKCSVDAPPGAEGVDQGTRCATGIAETGETQLVAIDGEATLSSLKQRTRPTMHLRSGDMAPEPGMPPHRSKGSLPSRANLDRLPDRIIRYEATFIDSYADELLTLTVQRNGVTSTIDRDDLIRARVVHFESGKNAATFCTKMGDHLPTGEDRLKLLHGDFSLVTGIINPFARPGRKVSMRVEFEEAIVNAPGPDIVIFDLQLLVYDPNGDKLVLRSGDERQNRPTLTVEQFDIGLNSPYALDLFPHCTYRAQEATRSIDDLKQNAFIHGRQINIDARALAVAIDLSNLGYEEGESLQRLEFLNTSGGIDPVLIVGLRP
ncbi:hypothetical protein Poly24_00780 [Rosistilla carotiformis]|uniref:FecR protein n=1 Tax=Rosistilla carotiformis TaxID=2528017 RepID=A0A518JLH6_9BACT|nr:hypothetical protein [Rosistilla carotiformis]QDV66393.1 hypothetical protein Poly24_00780 [Rosistilla carotiformis]